MNRDGIINVKGVPYEGGVARGAQLSHAYKKHGKPRYVTAGWEPTCGCGEEETVPCVVLDPFVGSGTTLCVAMAHDRRGVGIDLSETYLKNNAIPRIEGALMSRPGKAHLIPGRTTEKVKGGKSLIK